MELKIELRGMYPEYVDDVLAAINEMLEEYPILKNLIKVVHISEMSEKFSNCFATIKNVGRFKLKYEVKLNPVAFAQPNIQFLLNMTSGAYYYSVKSIIYHEVAHCLQLFMPCKKLGLSINKYDKYNIFNFNTWRTITIDEVNNAYSNYFNEFFKLFKWDNKKIVTHFGSYAANNVLEILPECFNLYYSLRNRPNNSLLEVESLKFAKEVIDDYKRKYLQFVI